MLNQNKRGIEKLDRQLQGQLVEAIELLKDVVEEIHILAPEALADVQADVLEIFNVSHNREFCQDSITEFPHNGVFIVNDTVD